MNVPPNRPRLVSTYPAAANSRSASRKVMRLMPSLRVSSRSGGSLSPGAYTPSLTPSSRRSTVSSKAFPVRTARKTAAVMAGDLPGTVLSPDSQCCLRQRNSERLDHRRKYRAASGGPFGLGSSGHVPPGHVPSGHVPSGHVPPGHVPSGCVPSGCVPVGGGPVHGGPVHGGADEHGEQARVAALFRVPLHAEHEARNPAEFGRPGLDRLDRAVFLPGHRLEPVTDQVDCLMVVRGHVKEAVVGQDPG